MPLDAAGWKKPNILAGVYLDDTPLDAEGYYISADKVRFVPTDTQKTPKAQTIGGWELVTNATFTGICRGMLQWADLSANAFAALGTHLSAWIYRDGQLYHATPVLTRKTLSNAFTTVNTSTTVSVADAGHGLTTDQYVKFPATPTVNGAELAAAYYSITVTDTDNYTLTADTAATSSGSGVGGSVDVDYFIAPGLQDSTGGAGYGTGTYGTGTYGVSSATIYYCRTWCMDNLGQTLLAAPRGGALYEMSPNLIQTELNPDPTMATGWTAGTGWAISGGVATASAGSASDLSASMTLKQGAVHILVFDLTRSAGTIQPKWGTTSIGSALNAAGHYRLTFYCDPGGAQTVALSKDASFAGTVENVSVKVVTNLEPVASFADSSCPATCSGFFVTDRGHVMMDGVPDENGNPDPLLVQWSQQRDQHTWAVSDSDQAGSQALMTGSRVVARGRLGAGQNYHLTDTGLVVSTYVPDPTQIYDFGLTFDGCGCIGAQAAVVANGILYWMAPTGQFFQYDGTKPQPIISSVQRTTFKNLAPVQWDKIVAFHNAHFGEVTWLYPDFRDGNECSRYVTYCYLTGTWVPGTFTRTAWIDAKTLPYPLAADTSGGLYYQEKGNSANGGPIYWSLQTGRLDLLDGNTLIEIQGLIPDTKDLQGGYSVTITGYMYNDASAPIVVGPLNVNQQTERLDFFLTAREFDIQFIGNVAPAFARFGQPRILIMDTGNQA